MDEGRDKIQSGVRGRTAVVAKINRVLRDTYWQEMLKTLSEIHVDFFYYYYYFFFFPQERHREGRPFFVRRLKGSLLLTRAK